MSIKVPETCKGMRDFHPDQVVRRKYMFQVISKHFERYGFVPLETPSMENLSTLTGKYGDEGDQLIFKVLSSGDYLKDLKEYYTKRGEGDAPLSSLDSKKSLVYLSDKALRYDLTIPFARYVAKYHREIPLPFKRYQMQPVWRADRPQKGRYREFYQCDADIIGSGSLLCEVDLLTIYDRVFREFGLEVLIKINSRKILAGIAEALECTEFLTPMTVALDKLDKIGKEAVLKEMAEQGISEEACEKLSDLIDVSTASTKEKIDFLNTLFVSSTQGQEGMRDLLFVLEVLEKNNYKTTLEFDVTLARGISYYTGIIFEVKSISGSFGVTIAAGGRYDNLTGIFGVEGLSGVGMSFGVDRIYDVLAEQNLFPENIGQTTEVLVLNFGMTEAMNFYPYIQELRDKGVKVELYPDPVKIKKQMQYADDKKISYVLIAGEEELNKKIVQIKNMETGTQETVGIAEVTSYFIK